MNIFILDTDIKKCAYYHNDKHVVKMILETAQMLCTVCHKHNIEQKYKPVHRKHPCTLWAEQSLDNYLWLCELGLELGEEYTRRYGKVHKSVAIIEQCIMNHPKLPENGLTPFAQAMPDQYKSRDAVTAYRRYYINDKKEMSTWKHGVVPHWFI